MGAAEVKDCSASSILPAQDQSLDRHTVIIIGDLLHPSLTDWMAKLELLAEDFKFVDRSVGGMTTIEFNPLSGLGFGGTVSIGEALKRAAIATVFSSESFRDFVADIALKPPPNAPHGPVRKGRGGKARRW